MKLIANYHLLLILKKFNKTKFMNKKLQNNIRPTRKKVKEKTIFKKIMNILREFYLNKM